MPQIFQVLRCYKCSVFQVHQTRKDNKWICKICGEKQSVKRHYGIGTGKDCRTHVQKLNKLRGDKDEASDTIKVYSEYSDNEESVDNTIATIDNTEVTPKINKESKWSAYIDEPQQESESNEPVYIKNKQISFDLPQKRKLNRKEQNTKRYKKSIDNKENSVFHVHNNSDNETESIEMSTTDIVDPAIQNFNSEIINICLKSKIEPQIDITTQNDVPSIILNKVNKDSKWAQYIETEVFNESDDDDEETEKNCNKQPLFSLCDDSEIDTILEL